MRIWSIHPRYLDGKGVVALWREVLLANAVLHERTRGYTHHPQLARFRDQADPLEAVNFYLWHVYRDAVARGYNFDRGKVREPVSTPSIDVTTGQIEFERQHLLTKLRARAPAWYEQVKDQALDPHPLFRCVVGSVEPWERGVTKS